MTSQFLASLALVPLVPAVATGLVLAFRESSRNGRAAAAARATAPTQR